MHSSSVSSSFISTALPYVNAAPHLGFALELVQADVLARTARRSGEDVCFVSGTDEHSLKNVLAAEQAGVPVQRFVAEHAERFRALARALRVSCDRFVRTSVHPGHLETVHDLWRKLASRGDLYRKAYRGLYCVGCEQFYDPAELADGRCPEHTQPLQELAEENWFFRLSRYREQLAHIIEADQVRIEPASVRREVLTFLRGEVHDLCVSRDAARARGFGIPVPDDPTQVVYVWVDALAGYLSALDDQRARYWDDAGERTHVIGKGITRFHAVYWLTFLLAAQQPLPTRILVHGYLTCGGTKISKSGESIDPLPLIAELGPDALRYYLLRHVRTTRDGDFARARLLAAHDAELANQLGNLLSRTLALLERHTGGRVPACTNLTEDDTALQQQAQTLWSAVLDAVEHFQLDRALERVFALVDAANRYVDRTEPWLLARTGEHPRLGTVLAVLCEVLFHVGSALGPFLPDTSERILRALGVPDDAGELPTGAQTRRCAPLFPRTARAQP